ncbi:hypothetical protein BT96DRAFT_945656 [Gymnopus androsaceus JB14]|uniref:Uncharacterized protein n=1 Tax=Gymnopus androsaceus JB14 TaxID=1447944 RepID=A0A6A4H132_9AGAR|nr:hypothetical protein BT96DRAFT_945656 [Gymnopus androsaceus JB14]
MFASSDCSAEPTDRGNVGLMINELHILSNATAVNSTTSSGTPAPSTQNHMLDDLSLDSGVEAQLADTCPAFVAPKSDLRKTLHPKVTSNCTPNGNVNLFLSYIFDPDSLDSLWLMPGRRLVLTYFIKGLTKKPQEAPAPPNDKRDKLYGIISSNKLD